MIDLNALCTSTPLQGLECEPKKASNILGPFDMGHQFYTQIGISANFLLQ